MELALAFNVRGILRSACLYGAGIIIGVVIVLMWDSVRSSSYLTDGLRTAWNGAPAEFESRLHARFPLGMPAGDMIRELNKEGFKPTWFEGAGYYGAVRREGWIPCRVTARVRWQLGPDDRLAYIDGNYQGQGCLLYDFNR
ncbi:hypothetical protein [Pseudomonas caspiana]|uniref:hypothetical protein n=1 Tax=Pseudomonas caspiana TaxID=1451454 RepID=UPI0032EF8A89